jgi:hypothetical protein
MIAVYVRARRHGVNGFATQKRQRKLPVPVNFLAFWVPAKPIAARRARPSGDRIEAHPAASTNQGGHMTIVTLEALRENPWNVLTGALPANPSELLLELAYHAANYCVVSEHALMEAARDGSYAPSWWTPDEVCPDAHEESEDRWSAARNKFDEICRLRDALHQRSQD